MQQRDLATLIDILQACRLAVEFAAKSPDRDAFAEDLLVQSAVIRQIEIVGEATRRLSEPFRSSQPQVP